jgi:[acyl-carrier-protein] S-malonyltransferase
MAQSTPNGARVAVLFPGQGSQTPEMRDDVARLRPDLLELTTEVVGEDPFARVEDGTRYQQPAILCASLAAWGELASNGEPEPELAAGHSMGEFAALAAAGALSEEDALRLVSRRGQLMDKAASVGPPGGMMAVLKGEPGDAERLAEDHGLTVANDNAPGQVVLSGGEDGLRAAERAAKERGLRAVRLPVSGAFHSPAMEPAEGPLREALDAATVRDPRFPVLSSITARPFSDVRAELASALTHPVRWRDTLAALRESGARRFVEVGPGKVLTGLVRRTLDDVEAVAHA